MEKTTKLSKFFYKRTKIWLIGLLLVLLVVKFMLLPVFEDFLKIDENAVSLDKPGLYSAEHVYEVLSGWGKSGRIKQFWLHITWDLFLPIIYFFFLGFLVSWFSKRAFPENSKLQNLNLVSLVALADLMENISLFLLILVYPAKIDILCCLKTGFTLIKYYIFGPAILIAQTISVVFAAKNRFKIRN